MCGWCRDGVRGAVRTGAAGPLGAARPSEAEQWMIERTEAREPFTGLSYIAGGEPGSLTLGVMICMQRAGDVLLTRTVHPYGGAGRHLPLPAT